MRCAYEPLLALCTRMLLCQQTTHIWIEIINYHDKVKTVLARNIDDRNVTMEVNNLNNFVVLRYVHKLKLDI